MVEKKDGKKDKAPKRKSDRTTVDVSGLRAAIENCKDDIAWGLTPFGLKCKILISERLAELGADIDPEQGPEE
ncbi:MAG: hypothetical protein WA954_09300 [Parerythrobacter sp.]